MNNKNNINLANSYGDQVVFLFYHLFFVVMTSFFIFIFNHNLNILDISGIKSALNSEIESNKNPSKILQISSKLSLIKGEVLLKRANTSFRKAIINEPIQSGDALETKDKSGALIEFGDKYKGHIRLGPNTMIQVSELMVANAKESSENSLFFLAKGVLAVLLKNNSQKVNLGIKTHSVAFGVRGTNFVVQADLADNTLLAVKEGKVEATSFISSKSNVIESGTSFIVTKDHGEKIVTSPDIINKYDWNMNSLEKDITTEAKVDTKIVDLAFAAQQPQIATQDNQKQLTPEMIETLKKKLEEELIIFKKYNESLRRSISKNSAEIAEFENILFKDKPKIEEDIDCLKDSTKQCSLYSEQLLIKRGWPNINGTPRVRASIAEDLRKYLHEIEIKKEKDLQEKIKISEVLFKRENILIEVESKLNDEKELENNLDKLQDGRLVYHFREE